LVVASVVFQNTPSHVIEQCPLSGCQSWEQKMLTREECKDVGGSVLLDSTEAAAYSGTIKRYPSEATIGIVSDSEIPAVCTTGNPWRYNVVYGRDGITRIVEQVLVPDGMQRCSVDSDCVVTETLCSFCCGGVGINKQYLAEFSKQYFEPACNRNTGPQAMCECVGPMEAECNAGRCEAVPNKISNSDTNSERTSFTSEEYGISFEYPVDFVKVVNEEGGASENTLVMLEQHVGSGVTTITLTYGEGELVVSQELAADWVDIDGNRGYYYYYREGVGYSGVLLLPLGLRHFSMTYDAIDTKQDEEEIEDEFASIVASIQLTPVPRTQLIQQCPASHIVNKMPCAYESSPSECNDPPREYYILDGSRREIEEFDSEWVKNNCSVTPEEVY
jgi:hypothetical protein